MLTDPAEGDDELEDFSDASATFGDRLVHAREALGLSEAELARRIGVKLQTLRAWESDRAEPRANRLQMLAGLLSVPMVWLMSGQSAGPTIEPARRGAVPRGADAAACLGELRALRGEQARLVTRLARLEKRLRAHLEPRE